MVVNIPDKVNIENFTIENNIIKGVDQEFPKTYDIGNVILDTLNYKPNHVSQIDADSEKQTTFKEMKNQSIRCGLWLKKQGLSSNDIITVCTHNHLDAYIPIFATFYEGATLNPWSHQITLNPARYLMKLFQPKIIFSCESMVDTLLEAAKLENILTKVIVFGKHPNVQSLDKILEEQSIEEIENFSVAKVNPNDTALIMLSSGSTGFPKGIMHPYQNLLSLLVAFLPFAMKEIALWYSTSYWITGIGNMFHNFFSFGTRIMHPTFDVEETCQLIEKYQINRTMLMPTAITSMCKSKIFNRYKLESLYLLTVSGSKANPQMIEEFQKYFPHILLTQVLGMTEVARYVSSQTENSKNTSSVGFLASCDQLKIVDTDTGEALGPNKRGELYLKSKLMMSGYYKNPEVTKETVDEEGWLHTGDEGYYDENGEIFITDRLKEVMKYQNHQVSPSEIEEVLLTHPGVVDIAVVPLPHELDGEWPIAFVKKNPHVNVTEEELIELSSTLGELKKLRGGVKFIDELPKTTSGKIFKPPLKQMAKELSSAGKL